METISLKVGSARIGRRGEVDESGYEGVTFKGRLVSSQSHVMGGDDSRSLTQSLYEKADGSHVIYLQSFTKWPGECNEFTLLDEIPGWLGPKGLYEHLVR